MSNTLKDEFQTRLDRLKKIRAAGVNPYPDSFNKKHKVAEILELKSGTKNIKTAGRIMTLRVMGKIAFAHLQDDTGKIQLVFKLDELGKDVFKQLTQFFDLGDFIGVEGEVYTTQKGEHSVLVKTLQLLSKTLRPLPEKWHGLKDQEAMYRQRYLDLVTNRETYERFIFRSEFLKQLRAFYEEQGFIEVETPILANTASGALARPFTTHHNSLNTDVFLRIAPETYLKECIIGGFEKVFEVARCFRNEGMDPSHLQDFTMVEHYAAYWNFEDNMRFTEDLFAFLLKKLFGKLTIEIRDRKGKTMSVNFKASWPRVSFRELILRDAKIDIAKQNTAEKLARAIKAKKIAIDELDSLGRGNMIDSLFKAVSREKIIQPTFLVHHPLDLSPLARRNDEDPSVVDRFQLIINTWEIVNAYSELVDPVDQYQRFEQQSGSKVKGDTDAHGKDDEYVRALEHGAPPTSGWGMGVDRLVALLTQQDNLRDVVLFPLLKPEH